jgi:putative membrane protein
MLASALLAFLHHLAAFTLLAALAAELALFPDRRLRAVDAVYGASAGVLLVVGLVRVFYFEKGAAYYFANTLFLAKVAVFLAVALLSIYPTVMFRRAHLSPAQTGRVRLALRLQLAGVMAIPLFAALMAKGIG